LERKIVVFAREKSPEQKKSGPRREKIVLVRTDLGPCPEKNRSAEVIWVSVVKKYRSAEKIWGMSRKNSARRKK
jgi:hypothetical protein